MMRIKLSIIVPVYNESKRLKKVFLRLDRFFAKEKCDVEYIFVDDGSSDNTLDILWEIKRGRTDIKILANDNNKGKGYSIKAGVKVASSEYVLFMDADLSTSLSAFHRFRPYMGTCDIIIGSRWCRDANIRIPQPWQRRFMGRVFYAIVNGFFLKGITDTNCGFKCYKKVVAQDIFSKQIVSGWGFDVELLYIAQKRNYSIKEVPVAWAHGRDSRVALFRVPITTLIELAIIKINDLKGCYE